MNAAIMDIFGTLLSLLTCIIVAAPSRGSSYWSALVCHDNVWVSNDGRTVSWTCTVGKAYTDVYFQIRYSNTWNFMSESSDHIACNKVTTDGNYLPRSEYHHYTCTINLPINRFTGAGAGAGNYQFMFRATVRVVDAKGGVQTEFKESGPKTLTLALPQVELVDCPTPQDYIKEGDTKTCGCRIKTQVIPPGQPVWLNSNGNLVGNDGRNGVKYLSLKYNSQYQNPTYYCRGVSPLGNEPDVTYTPTFAYGPSQMSISFNSKNKVTDSINKCEDTTSFTTYCDIAIVNVNPKPTMMVTSSDGSPITPQRESTPSGYYRYKYNVVPKGGGNPTITCQATNAIFSDITTTESKTITIQEPPSSAPVMTATISNNEQTVENGGTVTVTSGDPVQVKCRVDGGFPGVSKVTTACAGVENVNEAAEATQIVNVNKKDNNEKCSCKADHVTGCYHKTSEFTLNVQYTSSVIGYRANSQSQKLTVSADDTVTFVCDVEGNPRPTVSVKGQRSGETVTLSNAPSGLYGQRSTGSKVMSCQDTDEYRCVADNGVGDGVARTMSVFVECVPELQSFFNETVNEFSPINGTDVKVTIPIIVYPEPKEYTLTKEGIQNRRRRRRKSDVTREVDQSSYNVTFMPDQPPKGEVVLTMFGLTSSDSGHYVLNIDNGIGQGLNYTFSIIITAELTSDEEDPSDDLIIGIVVPASFVVIIVITLAICLNRRGKKGKSCRARKRMKEDTNRPRDDNDESYQRDSDFVEIVNDIYGGNTDHSPGEGVVTLDENPYEDTDLTNTRIVSKPAPVTIQLSRPAKKPTQTPNPSSTTTTDVAQTTASEGQVDNDVYSTLNPDMKSKTKKVQEKQPVETEDAYGFPLNKVAPGIPEKNFVDGDGSGVGGGDGCVAAASATAGGGGGDGGGALLQMPKNNNANSNHRHSKNNQTYNNMALVLDMDGAARIAVGSEDGTYFNNSNNVDNVYGNTPVPGGTDDDNVYGNAAITTDNAVSMRREEDTPGRYKNKYGLNYSYVEILPPKNDSSLSNLKQFRRADDGVQYSTVEFNNQ